MCGDSKEKTHKGKEYTEAKCCLSLLPLNVNSILESLEILCLAMLVLLRVGLRRYSYFDLQGVNGNFVPANRERLSIRDFFVNGVNGTTNLRDLPSDSDGNDMIL